jgi:hypothetical protein
MTEVATLEAVLFQALTNHHSTPDVLFFHYRHHATRTVENSLHASPERHLHVSLCLFTF